MQKKNAKKLKEQMKKLRAQMRQIERDFYVAFGKQMEKEIRSENCTVESIKNLYKNLKQEYGL